MVTALRARARELGGALVSLVLIAGVLAAGAFVLSDHVPERPSGAVTGLPDTPDYHSLLVAPDDSARLVLGTHYGLFESSDGGRTWAPGALEDDDAMNLVRTRARVTWAAGHGVLARSDDGGATWRDVSPPGLPHLDVHGFAADPANARRLFAAIAGAGLFRSLDGGASFELVSSDVGPDVFGLALTPDGTLFAGDARRGVLASADGGRSWRESLRQPSTAIAVNPRDPELLLASTPLGLHRSTTGGADWELVFPLAEGAGPLAWSPAHPDVAYAVGLDRRLYRSADAGRRWRAVTATAAAR
jgi:photosystem II stability/assembly factor-like uncharacterized protein